MWSVFLWGQDWTTSHFAVCATSLTNWLSNPWTFKSSSCLNFSLSLFTPRTKTSARASARRGVYMAEPKVYFPCTKTCWWLPSQRTERGSKSACTPKKRKLFKWIEPKAQESVLQELALGCLSMLFQLGIFFILDV